MVKVKAKAKVDSCVDQDVVGTSRKQRPETREIFTWILVTVRRGRLHHCHRLSSVVVPRQNEGMVGSGNAMIASGLNAVPRAQTRSFIYPRLPGSRCELGSDKHRHCSDHA